MPARSLASVKSLPKVAASRAAFLGEEVRVGSAAAQTSPAWEAAAAAVAFPPAERPARAFASVPEQYLLLITCRDEQHQVELLERFHAEGLGCRALLS